MQGVCPNLDIQNVQGTKVYGMRNTGWTLVKRNEQSGDFEPVDKIDRNVSSAELDANYGVWQDKEVSHGWWKWKQVDRPKDGKVQADKVTDFKTFRDQQTSIEGHWLEWNRQYYTMDSAEISIQDLGNGVKSPILSTEWSAHAGGGQYSVVSPLSPLYQAGWRDGTVGD